MTWYPNQGNRVSGIDQLTVVYDELYMSTGASVVETALPLVPVEACSNDGTYSVQRHALLDTKTHFAERDW